jgi:hypothetical protein
MIRSLTADIRWYQLLDSKGASVVISRVYREVAWLIKPRGRAYGGSNRIHSLREKYGHSIRGSVSRIFSRNSSPVAAKRRRSPFLFIGPVH